MSPLSPRARSFSLRSLIRRPRLDTEDQSNWINHRRWLACVRKMPLNIWCGILSCWLLVRLAIGNRKSGKRWFHRFHGPTESASEIGESGRCVCSRYLVPPCCSLLFLISIVLEFRSSPYWGWQLDFGVKWSQVSNIPAFILSALRSLCAEPAPLKPFFSWIVHL